jgi:S1-C subfamily serine protease
MAMTGAGFFPALAAEVDKVMELAKPAIVRIEVLMESGQDGRMVKQRGFGSGAIISPDGYVLTNHHVAGRGTRFRCTLADREEIPAKLIGTDALANLAIIQLDLSARLHPEVPVAVASFGDSAALKVGDTVYALGSPAALSQSVTRGIVANTEMIASKIMAGGLVLDGENVGELVRWIGHDAVIFGGNSGGPLVNSEGLIVGVNEVGIGSLGGAIPGNLAKQVAGQLIAKGAVARGWIGLEVQELLRGDRAHHGVLVAGVFAGSPADQAGVKAGDFLHTLNGTRIADCRSPEDLPLFNAMVLGSTLGSQIVLAGERDGKEIRTMADFRDFNRTLGSESTAPHAVLFAFERGVTHAKYLTVVKVGPEPKGQNPRSAARGWLGADVQVLGPDLAEALKLKGTPGVRITRIQADSPAGRGGLQAGDVLTKIDGMVITARRPEDARMFSESIAERAPDASTSFELLRDGNPQTVTITLAASPADEDGATKWKDPDFEFAALDLTDVFKDEKNLPHDLKAARVTDVTPNGWASLAGLAKDDLIVTIDGEAISGAAALEKKLGVMPSRSKSGALAAMQVLILPLAEIQRLSAKVIP